MKSYLDYWTNAAAALFAGAVAGEPELKESWAKPMDEHSFGWIATLDGDANGRFTVLLDGALLDAALLGEGMDQRAGWGELLKETANAACGELLARTGIKCHVVKFEEAAADAEAKEVFELRSGERAWSIQVSDGVHLIDAQSNAMQETAAGKAEMQEPPAGHSERAPAIDAGLELLLDVELEATLRFGSREMSLAEILDLGPGDVVELDRHVADPVDLIVGDKIVARGEVVLVNGNFSLKVTEVAAPKKRLETIRCLF